MLKRTIFIFVVLLSATTLGLANHTRLATLMAGDYIDDVVMTDIYPHRMLAYRNTIYLDITPGPEDFGIFFSPFAKYGVLGVWQNPVPVNGFNLGYAVNIFKFGVGASVSPVKDNLRLGIGVGRDFFNQYAEISYLTLDGTPDKWHRVTARYLHRMADFSIVPRYSADFVMEPYDYAKHRFGVMVQRTILNEGFVYLGAEYEAGRGDIEFDSTRIHAGVEMKLSRIFVLRCGVAERFTGSLENGQWQVEPGIGVRVRDFSVDLHLNKDRFFDKEQTFFKSVGLDFNFGRF
ncbi:hypothetical protein IBX73_00310 [candidate division WOR-3 bacterium]|nr:hypothetical protein [candidate division WOR-3 bacterium]